MGTFTGMADLDDEKAGSQIVPDTPDDDPPSPTADSDDDPRDETEDDLPRGD